MNKELAEKLDQIIQAIEKLNNRNNLHFPAWLYVGSFVIACVCVVIFIGFKFYHEYQQQKVNRQNALVQIYKATIEESATKNMSKDEIKEIFNAVKDCLNEKK